MKVRLNLDLDIELTEGGRRIQVSELWETAQTVAANAAKSVVDEVVASTTKEAPSEPDPANVGSDATHTTDSNAGANASQNNPRRESPVVPPTLHPLGTFLCDLLDRVAEASQTAQDNTLDDLKRGGPR